MSTPATMASTKSAPVRTQDTAKPDLWKQALATLSAKDRKQYEDCSPSMLDVLKQVCNHCLIMKMCMSFVWRISDRVC